MINFRLASCSNVAGVWTVAFARRGLAVLDSTGLECKTENEYNTKLNTARPYSIIPPHHQGDGMNDPDELYLQRT